MTNVTGKVHVNMVVDFTVDYLVLFFPGAPGMLSLDIGPELSTPGSTLELGAAGMLQVFFIFVDWYTHQINYILFLLIGTCTKSWSV